MFALVSSFKNWPLSLCQSQPLLQERVTLPPCSSDTTETDTSTMQLRHDRDILARTARCFPWGHVWHPLAGGPATQTASTDLLSPYTPARRFLPLPGLGRSRHQECLRTCWVTSHPGGKTGALAFSHSFVPAWLDADRYVLFYSLNHTVLQS